MSGGRCRAAADVVLDEDFGDASAAGCFGAVDSHPAPSSGGTAVSSCALGVELCRAAGSTFALFNGSVSVLPLKVAAGDDARSAAAADAGSDRS